MLLNLEYPNFKFDFQGNKNLIKVENFKQFWANQKIS